MGQPPIPDLASKILSPYDDGIQGNPVGTLQELCMSRRWPPPVYDLNHEEGLPHERMFTIHCVIEVRPLPLIVMKCGDTMFSRLLLFSGQIHRNRNRKEQEASQETGS